MATRIKKVHYVEDFKFKVNIPLDKELFYQATCKTLGVNTFVASWYYEGDVWVCENCAIDGDEITIFLTDHKLPAGKLLCHVESKNEDNIGIECSEIDPNIVLTFIPPTGGTDIDEIDEEQTLDIIRLDNELKEIKEKYADFDSSLTEIETNYNNAAKAHHERLDNIDKAISNVENNINENKKGITSLDKFTSTLSGRLDEEVNKINDRITNLILNSSTGDVDLSDVYQQINENKTTIALLRNYIDTLKIPEEVDLTPINDKLAVLEQGLSNLAAFEHDKYLTEHQDISHLATKEELEAYQLKGNYVDEKELEKYQLKGDYATTLDVDAINSRLDYFDKINHDSFATKEYVAEAITKIDVTEQLEHYVTQDELQSELDLLETDIADNYYNKEEVDTKITDAVTSGKVDLSNYVTTSQLNTAIENIPEYDDTELDSRITLLEGIDHSKYLTSHQDISNLATKKELQTAIDAIDIPETDLTDYYTKSEVDTKVAEVGKVDLSNYPTKSELNDAISNVPKYDDTEVKNRLFVLEAIDHIQFATVDSLNNYQPKGNYLTEHQDISHLVTKTILDEAIEGLGNGTASAKFLNTTEPCPDTENVLYFLYNEVDYIHSEYAIKDEVD